MIRILIVDDYELVRIGLSLLLQKTAGLAVVGEAINGQQAIALYPTLRPDVVIMDVRMPKMSGIAATKALRELDPHARILILSNFVDEDEVFNALQAGATSYLFKDLNHHTLAEAVRETAVGRSVLAPHAAQALVAVARRPPAPGHNLTGRELEILALMMRGCTNADIANQLFVSKSTVKKHVSSILAKLQVSNRAEAVARAFSHLLIKRAEHTHA